MSRQAGVMLFWGAVFCALIFDGETSVWPWLLTGLLFLRDVVSLMILSGGRREDG